MERPRVLYASFDELTAAKGAAVHIRQFAGAIAEVADLTLVSVHCGRHDNQSPAGAPHPYRHIELAVSEGNFLDRVMDFRRKLAALLRAESFRLIQFRSIWEGAVAAALGGEAALVYEANGLPSIELKYLYPAVAGDRALLHKLRNQELSLLAAARRILTPSPVTAQFIAGQGIRAEKIRVIPNGVDAALFSPPAAEPPGRPLRLLYAGTLAPWQGLEMLYRAMRAASSACDARLWVVGASRKQWLRRHRRLVEKLGLAERVEFREALPQPELAALVGQAHVGVAPLRANGWEKVLLPEVDWQQKQGKQVVFRADAAFAKPEIYEALEARGVKYAIRIPSNDNLERDIVELLTRPVGRPSHKPLFRYKSFLYQAESWKQARRVVAKVEFHFGELFPRVGFIVTNLETDSRAVVRFYNKRGTAEQCIKEGKQAVKMTRLSCHRFRSNEVRLWLLSLIHISEPTRPY